MLWYLKAIVYKHIQMKYSLFILASSVIVIYILSYMSHNIYLNICVVNRNRMFIFVLVSCNYTELIHLSKLIACILFYSVLLYYHHRL
jgi:hypothetical protein